MKFLPGVLLLLMMLLSPLSVWADDASTEGSGETSTTQTDSDGETSEEEEEEEPDCE